MKKNYYLHFCNSIALSKIYRTLFVTLFAFSSAFIYGQKSPDTPRYRTLKYLVSKKDLKDSLNNTNFQNNSYVASLIPATPEAAALGTYGNNPVSLGSGVASIPIPLYQIKQKDIGLDLSLSYHGGGVKVEEVAPWTGLSISLVGLGTITRTIRGSKADELTNGFIGISYNLDNINDWYQDGSHPTEVNQFKNDYTATDPIDTEADLFNFNFGKYSGKFVYNRADGIFYTVPRQNLKIEHNFDFSSWTITTEEGIKYVFGTSEITTSVVSNCSSSVTGAGIIPNAPTAWHLTQIVSPTDPTNIITINYLPETVSMTTNGSSKRYILISGCGGASPFNNNCQTTVTTISAKVSEIIFRNGKITFQRSTNNRCDNGGSGKTLQKIILNDANNQRIKATQLYHSYFGNQQANDATCGTSNFTGRLRLDSLKSFGITDNDSLPPHIFEYESYAGILPSTRSYAQDHWGYYNGATANDNLIPQYKYQNPYNLKWEVIGANIRETSPTNITLNQIKKVTYPTGGYSAFEFEANRYYQATCNSTNCLNEEATTQQKTCTYDAVNGFYPIVTFTINQGVFCRNSCQGGILADFTALGSLLGTGFDKVQFKLTSTNPAFTTIDISSQTFFTGFLPNGTYTLRGFYNGSYDPALDETNVRITWQQAISSDVPVGGLRIKKITDYDENANIVNLKNYHYSQEGSTHSSASIGTIPYYGEFTYFQGNSCVSSGILLSGESTYPLINTQGATVGYTRVEVTYGATGEHGKSVHTFTPVASYQTNFKFPTVATYMQDWKEGLTLTNRELSATNISLKADSSHHVLDINPTQSLFKFSTGLRLAVVPADRLLDVYFINAYRTPTDWFFTDFTEEKVYHTNGTDVVKIPKWFEYNNQNFMPSLTKTINSLGDTLKTEMKYPHDFSTDSIYAGMLLKNQSGMVIEQSEYVRKVGNSSFDFLMKKRTNYNQFNSSFFAPSTIETQYAGGTLTQEASFQYTNDALISSVTERNGITSTFTWFGTTDIGKRDLLKTMVKGSGFGIAQTTSFDYKPLVGLSSVIAPTTYGMTYTYDAFSRLSSVQDAQSHQLKRMFYHYRGQNTPTGLTLALPKSSNYVATFTARNAQTTLDSVTNNNTVSIAYIDGLGKSTQQVLFKGSPDKSKDILLGTTVFDNQSRPKLSYLPTPSDVNTGVPNTNFQSLAKTFYDNDNNPYSETIYEESPLNRPLQAFGAGQAWRTANKFVAYDYLTAGRGFLGFKIGSTGVSSDTLTGNTLIHSQVTSERGAKTIELKDRLGRVVYKLQQLDIGTFNYSVTNFIYDDLNRLTYCLPSEINKQFGTNTEQLRSFTENDAIFKEGMYAYHYDNARSRLVEKHTPGAGWTRYCYDKRDNLILENDDADSTRYWKMTKYDALNRPIMKGLIQNVGASSRQTIQANIEGYAGQSYETIGTGGLYGYTNTSFPSAYTPVDSDIKIVMYYDDYSQIDTTGGYGFKSAYAFHAQANAKGMLTGTLIRNLETNAWYKFVNYYDYKGRVIESFAQNHLGGIDRMEYQYRFNNEVLKMRITHKKTGMADIVELYEYDYDHIGRKTAFRHTKDGISQNVAKYQYDLIGRMKAKILRPAGTAVVSSLTGNWTNSSTWQGGYLPTITDKVTINTGHTLTIPSGQTVTAGTLLDKGILKNFGTLQMGNVNPNTVSSDLQSVDYKWHIRGLRGINLDANNNPVLSNGDLFSFKLSYEEGSSGYFDGNIASQKWLSAVDNLIRTYDYSYDGSSRILGASFTGGKPNENYSLENMTYDGNGNIKSLWRKGMSQTNTFNYIDKLSYTYPNNSNKLTSVSDAITGNLNTGDFRDGNTSGNDYDYLADGSLKKDLNKGISSIEYNYLKLPKKITFTNTKWVEYKYDANGNKLRKVTSDGITTDYVSNLIYENNVLYQIAHDEGRISNGIYEYNMTDYLGNLRVVFKDSADIAKITQAQDYEPFGVENWTSKYVNSSKISNFKFNGIEKQNETNIYLAKFRGLDSQIGRWTQIDPMADKYLDFSPYSYVLNNPLRYTDPDGKEVWISFGDNQRVRYDNGKLYNEDGKAYKGKDAFVSNITKFLNMMNKTEMGSTVLTDLTKSKNTFNFVNKVTDSGGTASFKPNSSEVSMGGTIAAGNLVGGRLSDIKKLDVLSHELFHGYQNEHGEFGASINKEVEAYIFGAGVTVNYENGMYGGVFGNDTNSGQIYEKAMNSLLFKGFDQKNYESAINNFKTGSASNPITPTRPQGLYANFPVKPISTNPIIKQFSPILK
ncbi:MAG: DUF6443 domain-containing protein [Bacteroidota bacterium]